VVVLMFINSILCALSNKMMIK